MWRLQQVKGLRLCLPNTQVKMKKKKKQVKWNRQY